MKIYVINGPNLNMLGVREPEKYGNESYLDLVRMLNEYEEKKGVSIIAYQSNHEGDLVDKIQEAYLEGADGIVINPGAYTHTSIAILDALLATKIRSVEVHVSDVSKREDFRQISYVREAAEKTIMGKGISGYIEALDYLTEKHKEDRLK